MDSADLKRLAVEPRFQTCKRSYMGSAVLQGDQFSDVQELHFQQRKFQ